MIELLVSMSNSSPDDRSWTLVLTLSLPGTVVDFQLVCDSHSDNQQVDIQVR